MMSNPQVLEIDINGDVIIDNILINSTNEDLVYNHIESAYNGYVAVGYTKYNGYLTPIVTNFDHLLNIVHSVVIPAYEINSGGKYVPVDAIGMHITTNVASGYILSGFTGGIDPNVPHDRKAIAMELDFGLGIIWSRAFNSPIQTGSTDFDMFTHAIAYNNPITGSTGINAGYFFSGSSNGSSVQEAAAVMLDLGGNVLWKKHYANNQGGGHRSVSGDAVYDGNTNLIHQLNNNTITHCWGISAFDATTGVRDGFNSWGGSVANTYPNIEALSLEPSLIHDYLCVAGYQRDHSWVDSDGVSNQGSVPFLAEVKKLGSIVWDKRYLIPNTRFLSGTPANDLLSTFTGQQTIIRHESMLTKGTSDYLLHTYRDKSPYSSGLEVLKVMPDGSNLCESEPLGLSTQEEDWFDEDTQVDSFVAFDPVDHVLTITAGDVITESCGDCFTDSCTLPAVSDIAFTYYDNSMNVQCLIGCNVGFSPPDLCPGLYCVDWDWGDGTSTGPVSLIGQDHCYNSSGTYTVCLTIFCCDNPAATVTYCEDIVVVCDGAPCELSIEDIDDEQMFLSFDSCCFGVCPTLMPWSNVDPMSLCIDIDWGDGSAPLLGEMFAMCYDHCYEANGTYTITGYIYCCDDPANGVFFANTVSCGGCELPADLVFYPSGSNQSGGAICPDGECEWNFCLGIDFDFSFFNDSHCFTWDYGDGTTQTSNTPECGIHCYQSGTYNVCLTVYCCDDPTQYVEYCETIVVVCDGAPCELSAGDIDDEQMFFSADSCCFGVCPMLMPWSNVDPMSLCIDIDWGDDSAPLLGQMFAMCYDHCYGANGTYTITVTVYCCDDPDISYVITETVSCGGCELPADLVFYPSGSNQSGGAICPDGECEWNFCLGIDFDFSFFNDSHCFTWDYGDGTTQTSNTPECGIHCYQSGTYNVCLTVYCCDDPTQYVEYCETIVVVCDGAPCELSAGDIDLEIIAFDDSPNGVCCFGVCPLLTPDSNADLMSLCIDIDWGDGSAPLLGQAFAACYDHCYGADGTYTITVTVYCCDNSEISYTLTETVSCGCATECYIRSSFWANIVGAGIAGDCVTEFDASIFLGPNMISHQNPSWTIDGVPVSNDYVFATLLASGTYNVCHSIEGTLNDGTVCEFSSCRDVQVNCCSDSGEGCGDINGDGAVTIGDLLQLLANFGATC
jgi:hypothetical protein